MMETQQRNTEYRHVENSNNINNQHIGQTNITVFYVHFVHPNKINNMKVIDLINSSKSTAFSLKYFR